MTGLNTVEPVCGVKLLKNMADQNMVVFCARLICQYQSVLYEGEKQLEINRVLEHGQGKHLLFSLIKTAILGIESYYQTSQLLKAHIN